MDIAAIQGFLDQNDHAARSRALQYFEQLKTTNNGWQMCIECLLSTQQHLDEPVKFFCFQILANYVKTRYQHEDQMHQQVLRDFIRRWIHMECMTTAEPLVIRNKAAQVICMVFLVDYPARWPSFFKDMLEILHYGPFAADMYLRVLLSINCEIADRETTRTQKEMELFTMIKDTIRDTCVKELVDSWHRILLMYHQSNQEDLICLCLKVIGAYIAWIDINLIANEHFVSVFVTFLSIRHIRDATCECIQEIINKGMDPVAKVKLVESFVVVLEQAGVLNENDNDEDFVVKLGNLVNGLGTMLLNSWLRLQKQRDSEGLSLAVNAVRSKVGLLLKFLNHEDEEVSQTVIEFSREYLQFLKHQATAGTYTAEDIANVEAILYIVISRYKYDNSTNFSTQGHEEALFEGYRKSLKNIFDNLALLDIQVVFTRTKEMIVKVLQQWQNMPFEDVEVAITFLYLLGEIVPICQSSGQSQITINTEERRNAMAEMVRMLVTCDVSSHGHVAVTLQFFETVVRFEKFFAQEPQHIPKILVAFMDSRGLRNTSLHVRSRTSYLFSRLIKCLKSQVQKYTEDILKQLQDLLVLAPPENGITGGLLSPDDQLYLYETAAILILSGQFEPQEKRTLLQDLLTPVFEKFELLLQRLQLITDEQQRHSVAKCMNHAIAVTSRTSKAFSSQLTMKSCGCADVYLKALEVFLGALNLPCEQFTLQSAVRQYLHRMVVCLEDEVLPYFPVASEQLLKNSDIRSIQEFIPLINQIISKFKKKIVPFLQQIFMPLVTIIFNALSSPVEEDQHAQNERQLLQRSYFLFIAAIVANNTTEVIASQDIQNLQQVLQTVIHGAVEFPDPVAQKTCFSILKKMVELWGGQDGVTGFVEFMYRHIVPACFIAPLKDTFDLSDAQTILALSESALCLKMVLEKRGDEFVSYLQSQYLPTLNISNEQIQDYCEALKLDTKAFKNYLKFFFQNAKT